MILNRHIFGALFGFLKPITLTCHNCNSIPDYQNTNDSNEDLKYRTGIDKIIDCNFIAFEETIFKCRTCGTYFAHMEWTPGGSDDAMQSNTYESFRRLPFLETVMMLNSGLEIMKNYANKDPRWYSDDYEKMKKIVASEKNELQKFAKEIVNESEILLKSKPSEKTNEYYREDTTKGENEVQNISNEYKKLINI